MELQQEMIDHLETQKELLLKENETFVKTFNENPILALTWSVETFQASTELEVIEFVLESVQDDKVTVEKLRKHFLDTIVNMAICSQDSNLPTSNLIHKYKLAAYAKVYHQCLREGACRM